jgi:hypothetical protein
VIVRPVLTPAVKVQRASPVTGADTACEASTSPACRCSASNAHHSAAARHARNFVGSVSGNEVHAGEPGNQPVAGRRQQWRQRDGGHVSLMLPLVHVTILSGGPCYDCRMSQSRKLTILRED